MWGIYSHPEIGYYKQRLQSWPEYRASVWPLVSQSANPNLAGENVFPSKHICLHIHPHAPSHAFKDWASVGWALGPRNLVCRLKGLIADWVFTNASIQALAPPLPPSGLLLYFQISALSTSFLPNLREDLITFDKALSRDSYVMEYVVE